MADSDHKGHRQRLRARFLTGGPTALADYELLELLLFGGIPQKDTKPFAKDLLSKFKSFGGVINASPEELRSVIGQYDGAVAVLKAVQASTQLLLREQIIAKPVLSSWQALLDYCRVSMGFAKIEEFRVLFLDRKNALIEDEVQARGTVDQAPVYPREVVRRALELGASALILVHNHPSGDPTPSRADIEMTREVARAAASLGIELHDHLVVARDRHASFRALGLL